MHSWRPFTLQWFSSDCAHVYTHFYAHVYTQADLSSSSGATALGLFDPTDLLPSSREFWFYKGSLTTPPCTEGVNWVVLKHHPDISPQQVRDTLCRCMYLMLSIETH